ncbi:MAG: hypothetical protein KBA31_01390 [Alphaproteobacteria bacterium]|nr:hypothetical protein [Alphaproteobacteria bacterium]
MRGALLILAIGAMLACANARARQFDAVQDLAQEKAAAVALFKRRASSQVATLAQDRLFAAYLTAATLGEGERLRRRIEAALGTLNKRFGIREVTLTDRSGEFVVRVGDYDKSIAKVDPKLDMVTMAGFAAPARRTAVLHGVTTVVHAAAVIWREQAEFVLSATQHFAAYKTVLARGLGRRQAVVLIDEKGAVLADSRPGTNTKILGGMSFDALQRALKGTAEAGAGEVVRGPEHFNVSYKAVDGWTVIAVETAEPLRRCSKDGARLCG